MKAKQSKWDPPKDLDCECLELCKAINECTKLVTTCSCSGHGETPYNIFFSLPGPLDDLLPLLYWSSRCHSGAVGWRVEAYTDCAGDRVFWVLEGPAGDFAGAKKIARALRKGKEMYG